MEWGGGTKVGSDTGLNRVAASVIYANLACRTRTCAVSELTNKERPQFHTNMYAPFAPSYICNFRKFDNRAVRYELKLKASKERGEGLWFGYTKCTFIVFTTLSNTTVCTVCTDLPHVYA